MYPIHSRFQNRDRAQILLQIAGRKGSSGCRFSRLLRAADIWQHQSRKQVNGDQEYQNRSQYDHGFKLFFQGQFTPIFIYRCLRFL